MVDYNQEFLEQKCAEWQEKLRIRNWHIIIQLVDGPVKYCGQEVHGTADMDSIYQNAIIRISKPMNRTRKQVLNTLFHEIIHILLNPLRDISYDVFKNVGEGGKSLLDIYNDSEEVIITKLARMVVGGG